MNKEIILDPEIKAMFELLAEDASTMEACMAKIKRSLSIAAELFHINKVELKQVSASGNTAFLHAPDTL